ncbi:MAG: N-acetyltransferase [Bacillota bacterium]|nr:MAG: N-acetyltransferase [Bacillota bacterium]
MTFSIVSKNNLIILRDMIQDDVIDYVSWFSKDTEWMKWDAPWERDIEFDENALYNRFYQIYHRNSTQLKDKDMRHRFQICIKNDEKMHIGWISSYMIDDQFKYNIHGKLMAIGLDIPSPEYRGKGYGYSAILTFIDYLHAHDIHDIYLQTWSGNKRMIEVAIRCGFKEVNRFANLRLVDGKTYDALTFMMSNEEK